LLLKESENPDLVIGSRFIKGGKDKERGSLREFISFFARIYISLILGLKIKDITSGFRVFKKPVIEKILPHLTAKDPFIVAESLYWVKRYGFSIKEVPIYFYNRNKGVSKLNGKILFTYLFKVLKLGIRGRKITISS
jgi:dolichol-phosphate mannosyltransferase